MIVDSRPERPPEIPYPFPPEREVPRRTDPVMVPYVDLPSGDPSERLFARRTVLVSGPLDASAAGRLCAQLLALDRGSPDDVELIVNSPGGPVGELAAVLDVVGLMRARVNVTCTGVAGGTAAALSACGTGRRLAGTNSRLSLRLPDEDDQGTAGLTADEVASKAEEFAVRREQLVAAVVDASGQPIEVIRREADEGGWLGAAAAVRLGLIDAVADRQRPA